MSHAWYEANAPRFVDAAAIEVAFVDLPPESQQRLNEFKLEAIADRRVVDWRDRDVLEFGAGHGRFALAFPAFRSYLGVDLSPRLAELGNARLATAGLADRARIVAGDCYEYDAPAASFDIVCSLGMLPYVQDEGRLFARMARLVRPGGWIFVDFHHSTRHYDTLRRVKWRLGEQTGSASRTHSKRMLRGALERAGLADVRFVMREYPLLGDAYARRGWHWPRKLRNALARSSAFDAFATDGFAFARRPLATQT